MKTLTPGMAKQILDNYNGLNNPLSLAYGDGICAAWLDDKARAYGFLSRTAMVKACRKVIKSPAPTSAFGLFDYTMLPKLNRMLKRHGLRLKQRSNRRQWGDQVEITVEWFEPKSLINKLPKLEGTYKVKHTRRGQELAGVVQD